LARLLVQTTVNEIMKTQASVMCEENNVSLNGYRNRSLNLPFGNIEMQIPKLRMGTYFPDNIIERWSRTDKALAASIKEMYTKGLSTRKIQKLAESMGIEGISSSQVSRIVKGLDTEVDQLRQHKFSHSSFHYMWLDATYIKCREDGRVKPKAVVTAIAVDNSGYKRFVGIECFDSESYYSWKTFLISLKQRGVSGVTCITSDAHEGLKHAIQEVYPDATWQRCIVHLERNIIGAMKNKKTRKAAAKVLKQVFSAKEPALVRELYSLAAQTLGEINKDAGKLMEEAEVDALAYLDFPAQHHKRLRTNNVQERNNREIKRRSNVVQVFPSPESMIRLVGALCCEIDEEWSSRRYFQPEAFFELSEVKAQVIACEPDEQIVKTAQDIINLALKVDDVRRIA